MELCELDTNEDGPWHYCMRWAVARKSMLLATCTQARIIEFWGCHLLPPYSARSSCAYTHMDMLHRKHCTVAAVLHSRFDLCAGRAILDEPIPGRHDRLCLRTPSSALSLRGFRLISMKRPAPVSSNQASQRCVSSDSATERVECLQETSFDSFLPTEKRPSMTG